MIHSIENPSLFLVEAETRFEDYIKTSKIMNAPPLDVARLGRSVSFPEDPKKIIHNV